MGMCEQTFCGQLHINSEIHNNVRHPQQQIVSLKCGTTSNIWHLSVNPKLGNVVTDYSLDY